MRMRDFGRRGADARVDAGGTRAGHGGSAAPSMTGGREDRGWRGHGGNAGVDGGQPRQNRAPTIMWTSTLCSYRVVKIMEARGSSCLACASPHTAGKINHKP
jgi:hypothetical protein